MADNSVLTPARDFELQWQRMASQLRCALPGIITAFDSTTQLCSVKPAIRLKNVDGDTVTYIELPILVNVPCVMPVCQNFVITIPVQVGDQCLLIFADRALDNFIVSGNISNPLMVSEDTSAPRAHALTDAICIVGFITSQNKVANYSTDAIEIRPRNSATTVRVQSDKTIVTTGGQVVTVDGSKITMVAGSVSLQVDNSKVTITGDVVVTGNVTIGGIPFNTHKHISASSGSPTGVPIS
jgi:phage baseplate assembly protein gpV